MNDLTEIYKGKEVNPNFAFLINEWHKWRLLIMQGGTRSGKTYSAIEFIVYLITTYDGLIISIVRETLPSLRASVLRDFKDIMTSLGYWSDANFNKTEFEYKFKSNLIEFFSVDNEQKVRGRKRQVLYINEANEIDLEKTTQLLLRTEGFAIMDYNPSMENSHIYDIVERDDAAIIITDYTDNPFLSSEIINEIERLRDTDPEAWKIYGCGVRGEGRQGIIYSKWVQSLDMPTYNDFWYGVDFGFANDPTAIVKIYFNKNSRTIYLKEVAYQKGLLNQDIIQIIKQDIRESSIDLYNGIIYKNNSILIGDEWIYFDNIDDILIKLQTILDSGELLEVQRQLEKVSKWKFEIYADSAEPKSIQEMRMYGLNAFPAMKGKGSVASQIYFLYNFRILYSGENIHKERISYRWKEKNKEIEPVPLDANNHSMDATRYGIYTHLVKLGYGF